MIKNKKIALFVMICVLFSVLLGFSACAKSPAVPVQSQTFTSEGIELQKPQITSCKNGIIEWMTVNGARAYILNVGGKNISDDTDGLYHSNRFDASVLRENAFIVITACGDGILVKNSPALVIAYDAETRTGTDIAITEMKVRLQGDKLVWDAVEGVTRYRIIDLYYNTAIVSGTSYDLSGRNLALAVIPYGMGFDFSAQAIIRNNIKYLDGKGTADDPYLINSPLGFRAVEYYEHLYELGGCVAPRNAYKIASDINYGSVAALESESNINIIRMPFYGTLDGNDKKLSDINVNYDGGYWALFDFVATGAVIKNIVFDKPTLNNTLQKTEFPLNASIATVANRNYGTIEGVIVRNAKYAADGGEVSGIASHNYGVIKNCSVNGVFKQNLTGQISQACYEMAGIVLENCKGGEVRGCTASDLIIEGSASKGSDGTTYDNVRTAGGIVAVNRAGGIVADCGYTAVTMKKMVANYSDATGGFEWGGIVAYNEGTVSVGSATIGIFTWNTEKILANIGSSTDRRGKLVGKNNGTCS